MMHWWLSPQQLENATLQSVAASVVEVRWGTHGEPSAEPPVAAPWAPRSRGVPEFRRSTVAMPSLTDPERVAAPARASEMLFEQMARVRPKYLLRLLVAHLMDGPDTALALEVAARTLPAMDVRPVLEQALEHPSPIVREAAAFALAEHVRDAHVRDLLARHTNPRYEESLAVRQAASDTLLLADG